MGAKDGAKVGARTRVAYLTVLYPATSHTFIHREVAGLRARGVEVRTFSLNGVDESSLLTDFERSERRDTVQIKALPKRRLVTTIARLSFAHPGATLSTLRLAIRGRGADLGGRLKAVFQLGEALVLFDACRQAGIRHVHAHFGQAPGNVAWFATEFAHRIGHTDWTFSITIHGPQDCLAEGDVTLRRKVDAAELVVAVSDFTAAQLLRRVDPVLWNKVEVVRCGIDLSSPERRDDRRDRATILMVARLSPEKGHVVAIEALARLAEDGIDARLRMVGPGDPEVAVLPAARALGVEDRVDVVGPLDPAGVAAELRRATVFALPSFAEGLPIVVMEAMANGCPVVASGISGIPELVTDGTTGLLVPPARADLLAEALATLLGDEALRSSMADAARRRVGDLHDGERQIDELLDVFSLAGVIDIVDAGALA